MKDQVARCYSPSRRIESMVRALFLVLTLLLTTANEALSQSLNLIQQDYNKGNYGGALADSEKLSPADANNALIHYLRANSWAKLGHGIEAQQEYQLVLKLSTDSRLKGYCQAALDTYKRVDGQKSLPFIQATNPLPPPPGTPLIEQQADSLSLAALGQADSAQKAYTSAVQTADSMRKSADQQAQSMASARTYDRYGNSYPRYTQEQIDITKQQAYDSAADYLWRAKHQSESLTELATKKAYELQSSAASLESQLQSAPGAGVRLLPEGTNLFVRNYASLPGSSSINPAQAYVPDDPGLAAAQDSLKVSLHPATGGQAKGKSSVKTEVVGKLLKSSSQ